jgi:protein-S-isoprenylcysteine O-methyltransferase Ste14
VSYSIGGVSSKAVRVDESSGYSTSLTVSSMTSSISVPVAASLAVPSPSLIDVDLIMMYPNLYDGVVAITNDYGTLASPSVTLQLAAINTGGVFPSFGNSSSSVSPFVSKIIVSLPFSSTVCNYVHQSCVATCVLWDTTLTNWTTVGVITSSTSNNIVECEVYHPGTLSLLVKATSVYVSSTGVGNTDSDSTDWFSLTNILIGVGIIVVLLVLICLTWQFCCKSGGSGLGSPNGSPLRSGNGEVIAMQPTFMVRHPSHIHFVNDCELN